MGSLRGAAVVFPLIMPFCHAETLCKHPRQVDPKHVVCEKKGRKRPRSGRAGRVRARSCASPLLELMGIEWSHQQREGDSASHKFVKLAVVYLQSQAPVTWLCAAAGNTLDVGRKDGTGEP